MREVCYFLVAFVANGLGFACLALSISRHWQDVADTPISAKEIVVLRVAGYSALAASLLIMLLDRPSFGSVMWVLMLSVTAAVVAFILTWRPTWLTALTQLTNRLTSIRMRS